MIKSKLRIAPGSYLPYLAALLALVSAAGYLISWQVTGSQYRFNTFLDTGFPSLGVAGWLQFGAMVLLAVLMLFAAKRSLPLLAVPVLLYSVGLLLLTLDSNEKNYPLLVIGLIFFWFFVVTSFSVFHSKWPLCVVEGMALAAVAVFCIMGEAPFVKQDAVMGKCYDLSLLLQVCGYYGGMLVLSLAISKKFNMEMITATTRKEASKETAAEEVSEEAKTQRAEEPEGEPVPEVVETVREEAEASQPEAGASEPVPTVPVSGSRLQKVLKEETVYDRDQRLMYKKKINIFSVLGLILSALTVLLGVIITFELVNTPVLKNDAIGLPMLAMGLFMACIFGTRVTYKEYYTKTVVTERKVVREESNWEEVLASRLEEDEQSIAALTENYTRMTELYGKLLENTSELMNHMNRISALQNNPELGLSAAETEDEPESAWEPKEVEDEPESAWEPEEAEDEPESAWEPEEVEDEPKNAWEPEESEEEPENTWEPEEAEDEPESAWEPEEAEDEPESAWEPEDRMEQPEVFSEELTEEAFGQEPHAAAGQNTLSAPDFEDLEDQVVFDPAFLNEPDFKEVFAEERESGEEAAEADAPTEFILPTFRGFYDEEEESETEVEQSETADDEPLTEAASAEEVLADEPLNEEPEMPETGAEIAESDAPVSQAEERRRRLQERLQEIYRRNQELQKAEAENPEEWF